MKASMWIAMLGVLAACGSTPSTPALVTSAERGRVLFRDKGCVMCHVNARVGGETGMISNGPVLTAYRNDPAYIRRWLADPAAIKPGSTMSNLHLSPSEVDDLVAFLNQPR